MNVLDIQMWIHHYGYFGVFLILFLEAIAIPFPAETTLTFSGIEWSQHIFGLAPLVAVSSIGNMLGSTAAYFVGKYLGRFVILKWGKYVGITSRRLDAAEQKFQKYQATVVLLGKFIAGVRVLVPYLAGINEMPLLKFTFYNGISAIAWATTFVVFGRYLGVGWQRYHGLIQQYWILTLLGAVLVVAVYLTSKVRKRK